MKKINIAVWIWVIIFAFIGLLIFQNQQFFTSPQSLRLNLAITDEFKTRDLPVVIFVLGFFFSGILLAYLFGLPARYKTNKVIKQLNADLAAHLDEISNLKREIAELKGEPLETQTETSRLPAESPEAETTDRTVVDADQITTSAWATSEKATDDDSAEKTPTSPTNDESKDRPNDRN